jgi:hypothetical protein
MPSPHAAATRTSYRCWSGTCPSRIAIARSSTVSAAVPSPSIRGREGLRRPLLATCHPTSDAPP